MDAILDQEIQNMHVENPVGNVSGINNNQVQSPVSQPVSSQGTTVKKRKKQS
ncbi:hypothetical protein J5751_02345 [bacterium]|nr:hypothetical protein [bacterium]